MLPLLLLLILILVCLCKVYGYCCYLTSVLLIRYNWCAELLLIWLNSYWDIDYVSDGKAVRQIRQPIRIMLYKLNFGSCRYACTCPLHGPRGMMFPGCLCVPRRSYWIFQIFHIIASNSLAPHLHILAQRNDCYECWSATRFAWHYI